MDLFSFLSSEISKLSDVQTDKENIRTIFREFIQLVNSSCGVVVLRNENNEFEETASEGYGEDGFFYDFLIRGKGYFEKMESANRPIVFLSENFQLSRSDSACALVSRIYKKSMQGFILIELNSTENLKLISWSLAFLAEKLASIFSLDKSEFREPKVFTEHIDNSNQIMLSYLLKENEDLNSQNIFSLIGEDPSSLKEAAKCIGISHYNQDLMFMNSLPEHPAKLEKMILDWKKTDDQAFIVFENAGSWTLSQQKLIFDLIMDRTYNLSMVFIIHSEQKDSEGYKPFWDKIQEKQIRVLSLNEMSTNQLRAFLIFNFEITKKTSYRKKLQMDDKSLIVLSEVCSKLSFSEMRALLENLVNSASEMNIDSELIKKYSRKNLSYYDEASLDLRKSVEALEKQKILLATRLFSGNQVRIAKALGISRGSLQYKMKTLGLTDG
ncbi:MAG TPA: helix-turn-helix domain-containing protein [Leptospiraceae bacterium]|nr:helix-turn-helix domain-containing protein [Leptospiraceae bacterium]HMZ57391.1 helix-turn-helix domain-containing protein [Leptospiraceae bacterium]HNF12051.1 helix-turn-helix domain-containing protein [Leptospiraceae bacterium]HNM03892.1 helix-turn-helix domain-containing protein [Leptospiraceae bacterium]